MRPLSALFACLLCLFLCCATAFGQSGNATLTGTVTDASGAVIPGAKVTVTNVNTGVAKTLETTASGLYVASGLIPGVYKASASATGFAGKEVLDIRLVIDQAARVDFQLQVGASTQAVTVTADAAPLLQTEEASVGFVVQSKQVVDLPLNGRYFTQLLQLAPGSVDNGAGRNNMPFFDVNGQNAKSVFFRMDGIENNEREFGGANIPISVDAIQEVKLQTSNFSAEYGRSPIQVDVVVKSGTNQVHGSLFEFLRNDAMDATNWTYNGPHTKNLLKRNQFGGTVGGPIKKDKLFYFFSYDGTREVFSSPRTMTLPSDDMRNGIFPAGTVIYDPLTQKPFANNTIPTARFNPIDAKTLAYLPKPNTAGLVNTNAAGFALAPSQNWFYDPQRRQTVNQYNLRVDYTLSEKDSFFARYTNSSNTLRGEGPLATNIQNAINGAELADLSGQNLSSAWYHNISPYTINELRGGFSTNPQNYQKADNTDYASQLGLAQFLYSNAYPGFPHFQIGNINLGSGDYRPLQVGEKNFHLNDALTMIRGSHNLRIGGEFRKTNLVTVNNQLSTGRFTFNGVQTRDRANPGGTTYCPGVTSGSKQCTAGDAFADFLLGYPSSTTKGTPIPLVSKYFSNWAGFINDTWKLNKSLTLTLGLRYEYQTRFHGDPPFYSQPLTKDGEFTGVIAVANDSDGKMSSMALPDALANPALAGDAITCRAAGLPDNCMISQKNAIQPRLGFAWQINPKTVVRSGAGIFYGSFYGDSDTESCQSWPLVMTLSTQTYTTPPSGAALPPLDMNNPFAGANAATPSYSNCASPNRKLPASYQWNLTVERTIDSNTTLSVGYVGNGSRHLDNNGGGGQGAQTRYNLPSPWGVVLAPGQKQVRAFPQFGNVALYESRDSSSYNSLQAKVERRLKHGLALSSTYTWAKNMQVQYGLSDPRNAMLDRGPSNNDIGHVLTVSPIYQVPVGIGRRFANKNRLLDGIIGGWQLSSIVGWHSGRPFTPTISGQDLLRLGSGQNRPDRVCSGSLSNPTVNQWYDPTCFIVPVEPTTVGATLRPGTSGVNILRGPGAFTLDAGISKTFRVTEGKELDFRGELFNAFNHPVLGSPATNLNLVLTATPQTRITGTAGSYLPRIVQLALKLRF